MGLFESKILEGDFNEPEWLEKESYGGLRVWHLGFFGFSGFVCVGLWHFSILHHNNTFSSTSMTFHFVLTKISQTNSKIVLNYWFSHLLFIVVMLCCCFRFRIPRTKQEIEADYQRRCIARNFRERLANIKNCEMDNMNLQKGERFTILFTVPNKHKFVKKKMIRISLLFQL